MRRKRGVLVVGVLFVFLGVLLSGVGSAQTEDCSTDQIILRLASNSNANGEAYNGVGNYPIGICYEKIFGSEYSATDPNTIRTCVDNNADSKPDNIVLRLSDSVSTNPTNSHAEGPQGNGLAGASGTINYNAQICYGNLQCEMIDSNSGATCGTKKLVVRLFDKTNAHLQTVDPARPVGDNYRYLICCSAGAPPIKEAYWASDPAGTRMAANALIDMSTTVYLVAKGVASNKQVTFAIKDRDTPIDTDIATLIINADAEGVAMGSWFLNDGAGTTYGPNINIAFINEDDSAGDIDNLPDLDLFFTATANSYSQTSGIILLNKEETAPPQQGGTGCDWYNKAQPAEIENLDAAPNIPTRQEACDQNLGEHRQQETQWISNNAYCSANPNKCYCKWDTEITSNNCVFVFIPEQRNFGGNCIGRPVYTSSYGECNTNTNNEKITISCEYEVNDQPSCDALTGSAQTNYQQEKGACEGYSQTKDVSCLAPTINVPFFGMWEFMISVLGIVGIYFLVAWRERRLRRNG